MKVLYLTYDGLSDPLGQSQVLPYLFGLSHSGNDITIVSFEKKENLKNQFIGLRKKLEEKKINWIILSYTKHPPVLSTVLDILKLRLTCSRLQKTNNFQIVHCRSYITSFIGLYLKKRFGLKFIFDMRGFYADERVDGGLWKQNKLIYRIIYRFFKRREKAFFLSADWIVSLTHAAKRIISKNFPPIESRISVIPCCVDDGLFNPGKIDDQVLKDLKNKTGIQDYDFILGYLGGLGTWYLLDEMLDFYKRLSEVFTNARFMFVTTTPEKEIKSKATKKNILTENIIVIKAERNEVPLFISLFDISVFFILPSFSKIASSPTKQAEVMAMGIPVVCNTNIGDTEDVINQSGAGLLIEKFTTSEYDKVIHRIPFLLKKSKGEIRTQGINMFSLEKGVTAYQKIYAALESSK
jgi:glycosyltransferase involved in cell wall biosynthesis